MLRLAFDSHAGYVGDNINNRIIQLNMSVVREDMQSPFLANLHEQVTVYWDYSPLSIVQVQ
jgi:hypothetical protein